MSTAPKSNRREFLQGKSASDTLVDLAQQMLPGGEGSAPLPPENAPDSYLLRLARSAMACTFEIYLNAGQYPDAQSTALAALDLIDRLEDQLSVYRAHSEVSQLNERASEHWVQVEPRLFALLAQAVELHDESQGAYDVTAGQLSRIWGFTRRAGRLPQPDELAEALARVGSQFLELNEEESSIRFTRAGLQINLGSIGKGYALDRAAELFESAKIHDLLIHGGNSSVLARGSNASLGPGQGWLVGVRNPNKPTRYLGQLRLHDRALSTSGSGTQFFTHEGRRYGHILDPRTGWPADGVLSVTVVAPTAAQADALSTAFYVLGPTASRAYCEAHPSVSAMMLCAGERQGQLTTHLIGVDPPEWIPANESK